MSYLISLLCTSQGNDAELNTPVEEAQQQEFVTTYTDADGTIFDWDYHRQGWFPRVCVVIYFHTQ